ncbi:beta-lactamase family protein [Pseudomonas sp. MSSRFD41]|uniref:serine hydrolase domain-containing protein n=1 Tax=Pseudomonas sp. MSSRFD41 TaxID=1310370 RepID=UPI00163AB622|nr:serine hydrolase domain-containing protein [Pseudomonas sp. MSSRFD41]MBC2658904.1 beta-lactamase family protein [Pseudomonas sp. MSSRFD41]
MRSMLATLLLSLGSTTLANAAATPAFDQVFRDLKPDQPGCAAGVMRDGKVIWSAGYGIANLQTGAPIRTDTLFNLASVSKQFTAFAILQLEAQGRLSLDDSVRRFFPELPVYAQDIKIRHLLHHTSGLQDYMFLAELAGIGYSQRFTQQQALQMLFKQNTAMFPSGVEFSYSNSGYMLLSSIVERASGMPLKNFSQAHIFKPLGMTRTSIVDQYPLQLPNLAESYEQDPKTKAYQFADVRWEQTGDGQVHSTVVDVMRWMRNLSTGQVGGQALVGKMRQTEPLADGDPGYYGMGVGITRYRGFDEVSHSGGWAGYNTHVAWYPKMELATVVLCNSPVPDASARGYALMDAVLGSPNPSPGHDIPPPVPSIRAVPPAPLNTLVAGTYLDDSGHQFQLQRTGNGFKLDTFSQSLALSRLSDHLLAADNDGSPIYLAATRGARIVSTNPASTYTLAAAWKPADLQRYVGRYQLRTTPGQLEVFLRQGRLYIRTGEQSYPMQPLALERFRAGDLGVIRFEQDGQVLTSSLARNLRFVRARAK